MGLPRSTRVQNVEFGVARPGVGCFEISGKLHARLVHYFISEVGSKKFEVGYTVDKQIATLTAELLNRYLDGASMLYGFNHPEEQKAKRSHFKRFDRVVLKPVRDQKARARAARLDKRRRAKNSRMGSGGGIASIRTSDSSVLRKG